jgi:glutathione S-transferase
MSEIDVKYLREKNIAQLLEAIASELVVKKPVDPETYIRDRFDAAEDRFKANDEVRLYGTTLDPNTTVSLLAGAFAKLRMLLVEVPVDGPAPTDFTAVSPFGRVPVVDHNGTVVLECRSVVEYLCAHTSAVPVNAKDKAKVLSALEVIQLNVLTEAITAVNEKVFLPKRNNRPVDAAAVQSAATKFRSALATFQSGHGYFLESHWVFGNSVTVADLVLAGAVFSLHYVAGFDCVTGLDKISKWWAAMQEEAFFAQATGPIQQAAAKLNFK